jgi:hypothetical protein
MRNTEEGDTFTIPTPFPIPLAGTFELPPDLEFVLKTPVRFAVRGNMLTNIGPLVLEVVPKAEEPVNLG